MFVFFTEINCFKEKQFTSVKETVFRKCYRKELYFYRKKNF